MYFSVIEQYVFSNITTGWTPEHFTAQTGKTRFPSNIWPVMLETTLQHSDQRSVQTNIVSHKR